MPQISQGVDSCPLLYIYGAHYYGTVWIRIKLVDDCGEHVSYLFTGVWSVEWFCWRRHECKLQVWIKKINGKTNVRTVFVLIIPHITRYCSICIYIDVYMSYILDNINESCGIRLTSERMLQYRCIGKIFLKLFILWVLDHFLVSLVEVMAYWLKRRFPTRFVSISVADWWFHFQSENPENLKENEHLK